MNNKYNIMVTYAGEGNFKFVVKKIGEVNIEYNKPVYFKNVDADTINSLRLLKKLLLNVNIGAKPDGAYRVYDMEEYSAIRNSQMNRQPIYAKEPIEKADISSILSNGTNGPIVLEEPKPVVVEEKVEEIKVEEKKPVEKKTSKKKVSKKTAKKK